MDASRITPFGSWKSTITADMIVGDSLGLGQIALDGADIYWIETRPMERGRNAVVRARAGQIEDVLVAPFSARSRVHEYGGGAIAVADGTLFFCNDADQRVYCVGADMAPRAITPEATRRYADLTPDLAHRRLLAICEEHDGATVRNTLVALGIDGGETRTLVEGADFYAAPRVSPDGRRLAWFSWNHPDMPWDRTELWLADVLPDGALANARRIAGGSEESIMQPSFAPDGTLYFISDRNNWWNLYRWRDGAAQAAMTLDGEIGWPHWVFGESAYAFFSADKAIVAYNRRGSWQLAALDLGSGGVEPIANPYCEIHFLLAGKNQAAFIGASTTATPAITRFDAHTRCFETLRRSSATLFDSSDVALAEPVEYPTSDGDTSHAFFYAPKNKNFAAQTAQRPPLLVMSHGGPTSSASHALNLKLQYWTSRGFAVLDVNYRGSTGFGRIYRRALYGRWGVVDVDDCVHGARFMAQQERVDASRLAIRGGSAGGYTTLCALVFHDVFRAGAVYYGVSDLEALARDTHKFELRYLDQLIGPYSQRRDLYRTRSPLYHVEDLSCPVIFFQGLDDKVVPPDQTEKMVRALRKKHIPVACLEFEGEAHGFRRADTIKRTLEAELYFYSRIFEFTPADSVEPVTIENL